MKKLRKWVRERITSARECVAEYATKLKGWARERVTSALQDIAKRVDEVSGWVFARYSMSIIHSVTERVAAGFATAGGVAFMIDPASSGWVVGALTVAGVLIHLIAKLPEGGK